MSASKPAGWCLSRPSGCSARLNHLCDASCNRFTFTRPLSDLCHEQFVAQERYGLHGGSLSNALTALAAQAREATFVRESHSEFAVVEILS